MKELLFAVLTLVFLATGLVADSPLAGSNATPQVILAVRLDMQREYYPDCQDIRVLSLVDLQPQSMRGKRVFQAGDKWSEKWKIDACGSVAEHPITFELIAIQGQIALSQRVLPAVIPAPVAESFTFAGKVWILQNRQKTQTETMREFTTNNESVQAWSKLLTIFDWKESFSIADGLAHIKARAQSEGCPPADLRILSEKSDEVVYYRSYARCAKPDKEYTIARMVNRAGKTVTIIYAARTEPNQQEVRLLASELSKLALEP